MTDRPRKIPSRPTTGFTLVEMLVVIAIIVLAMTLAIPAIRSLTGSRSIDAAENIVTSYIAMTRAEAIGQQQIEGVMFFLDITTDRVNCIAVKESPGQTTDAAGILYLDLVDNRDPVALPTGTRLWTIKDSIPITSPPSWTEPMPNSRFLGFNSYETPIDSATNTWSAIPGGVILFDGHTGQLTNRMYGFHFTTFPAVGPKVPTALGRLCFANDPSLDTKVIPNWPVAAATPMALISQVGLVLFDRETFTNQSFIVPGAADQNDITGGAAENAIDAWIDSNTTPEFVNRYDGTLMRAE